MSKALVLGAVALAFSAASASAQVYVTPGEWTARQPLPCRNGVGVVMERGGTRRN
jgi:hypothetical protein